MTLVRDKRDTMCIQEFKSAFLNPLTDRVRDHLPLLTNGVRDNSPLLTNGVREYQPLLTKGVKEFPSLLTNIVRDNLPLLTNGVRKYPPLLTKWSERIPTFEWSLLRDVLTRDWRQRGSVGHGPPSRHLRVAESDSLVSCTVGHGSRYWGGSRHVFRTQICNIKAF